MLIVAVVCPAA